jgi:O-antigen/teichoic acid export membrane protein
LKILKTLSIFKGEFAQNAFILTFGTAIAQIFPLIFYPVLSRIYAPEEFGLLAIVTSITSILAVISTGKYESSILIAGKKKDAANIIIGILIISFIFLSISFVILQILSTQLSLLFNEKTLKKWLYVCPLAAFSIVIFDCYNEWCVRNKRFKTLSGNKVTNSSAITIAKMLFGIGKVSENGLIMGDLIGRAISSFGCVASAIRNDRSDFTDISITRIKTLFNQFAEFPKFTMPAQLLNTLGISIPVFFIGVYFDNTELGYYAMTMAVLSVPVSVISNAVRDVFRQRANEEYNNSGSCIKIFSKVFFRLVVFALAGCFLIIFFLPSIFSIILGEPWRIAGEYSQILCPMVAFSFVSTSLGGVLIIAKKMKIGLYWQIYYVTITILALTVGSLLFHNIKITLLLFALGRISAYSLDIILSYKYAKGSTTR